MTDDEADRILTALGMEGFAMPYMARVRDYCREERAYETSEPEFHQYRVACLEVEQQNRGALRRALGQ
jgi:hypothetical protein